jgi:hypothetical protein
MRLPYGFRLHRPCHSELVELLRQAAKARGECRRGISGGFAQDDSVGRREDIILPYGRMMLYVVGATIGRPHGHNVTFCKKQSLSRFAPAPFTQGSLGLCEFHNVKFILFIIHQRSDFIIHYSLCVSLCPSGFLARVILERTRRISCDTLR